MYLLVLVICIVCVLSIALFLWIDNKSKRPRPRRNSAPDFVDASLEAGGGRSVVPAVPAVVSIVPNVPIVPIKYPPSPVLPKLPTGIWDPMEKKRGFRVNFIEGTYGVVWYGDKQSLTPSLRTLVANLDKWYVAIQTELGYSVSRTIQEQLIEEYKFNVYFNESGLGGYPKNGNFLGRYGEDGKYIHYISTDIGAASHELGHLMQLCSKGFRNDNRVGWGWESNANYITYKMEGRGLYIANDFLARWHWKRMDSFEDMIQYKSWIWWQCLEAMHGRDFVGKLWSNVAQGVPQFEEVARVTTGGDVPTMFAQYVRCAMQLNFGNATELFIKEYKNSWGTRPFPMQFEATTLSNSKIRINAHRLQRFAFVLVDVGSVTPTGLMYKAKVVPLSKHAADAWRGVHGNDILRANEWTQPFEGKRTSALGITCATREGGDLEDYKVCKFEIHLEVVP